MINVSQFVYDVQKERNDQRDEEDLNINCFIFLDESLTGTNRKLTMEAKKKQRFYIIITGVRYKWAGEDPFEITGYIVIWNMEDLNKIT